MAFCNFSLKMKMTKICLGKKNNIYTKPPHLTYFLFYCYRFYSHNNIKVICIVSSAGKHELEGVSILDTYEGFTSFIQIGVWQYYIILIFFPELLGGCKDTKWREPWSMLLQQPGTVLKLPLISFLGIQSWLLRKMWLSVPLTHTHT